MPITKYWNTDDEISMIAQIGKHYGKRKLTRGVTRMDGLKGYLKSCAHRVVWGDVDKDQVIGFCVSQIFKEARGEPVELTI